MSENQMPNFHYLMWAAPTLKCKCLKKNPQRRQNKKEGGGGDYGRSEKLEMEKCHLIHFQSPYFFENCPRGPENLSFFIFENRPLSLPLPTWPQDGTHFRGHLVLRELLGNIIFGGSKKKRRKKMKIFGENLNSKIASFF